MNSDMGEFKGRWLLDRLGMFAVNRHDVGEFMVLKRNTVRYVSCFKHLETTNVPKESIRRFGC